MTVVATLAGLVLCSAPAPAGTNEASNESSLAWREGESMVRLVDHHAHEARRERLVRGSFGIALAGAQIGLGVYGAVALADDSAAMRRASIGQLVAGSLGFANSIAQVAIRSPLERARRSPSHARLAADPGDGEAFEHLLDDWDTAATRARKRRFATSGVSLGVGVLLTTLASVRLGQATAQTPTGEQVWAYTTLTSSLGLVVAGVSTMLLPSESERSHSAYEAGRLPSRIHARVLPHPGGLSIAGRF